MLKTQSLTYAGREKLCSHPTSKRLFSLMSEKESNLCVAADLTKSLELIQLAEQIGPSIVIFKTHIDIVEDFSFGLIKDLQALSKKHNFLLFEDRKFADIGQTVLHQYSGGLYKIADWAHITNAHTLPGPGVIEGLKKGAKNENALLLLAEMSSLGQLADEAYAQKTVTMAKEYPEFVIGFICQKKLTDDPRLIHMTPGVKMTMSIDGLKQQYRTPEKVIVEDGTDVIIVGRGITQADDAKSESERYREAGWAAYLKLLHV